MKRCTIDLETYYTDEYNIRKMTTSEYVLDPRFRTTGIGVHVEDKEPRFYDDVPLFMKHAAKFLRESALLAHHAHFDGLILNRYFGIRPAFWFDTLSMGNVLGLNLQVGGSLAALMRHFSLGEKAPLSPDSTLEEIRTRALSDVVATSAVFLRMVPDVPLTELQKIDWTVRCFTEPILRLDLPQAENLVLELREKKQALLDELGVTKKMLGSNEMLADLFRSLGVEPPMKPSPKKPGVQLYAFAKTDRGMQELLDHEDETVAALASARLDTKSGGDETRCIRLIQSFRACGRLPVYLKHAAAHTLRWGGSDKQNWQNFSKPRKDAYGTPVLGTGVLKKCIVAPPGHVLVVGDLSQVECRINFWLARQTDALDAFRDGRDLYCEFGGESVYQRAISKADTLERFVSKTTVLGFGFGCGPDRMREEVRRKGHIEIGDQLARKAIYGARERWSNVPKHWKNCEHLIGNPGAKLGPVISEGDALLFPDGLRIFYPELRKDTEGWSYRGREGRTHLWGGKVAENIAQRLARIIISDAIVEINKTYRVATMAHDDLVAVVLEADADEAKAYVEQQMSWVPGWGDGWEGYNVQLPLAAEVHAHRVFGEAK